MKFKVGDRVRVKFSQGKEEESFTGTVIRVYPDSYVQYDVHPDGEHDTCRWLAYEFELEALPPLAREVVRTYWKVVCDCETPVLYKHDTRAEAADMLRAVRYTFTCPRRLVKVTVYRRSPCPAQ